MINIQPTKKPINSADIIDWKNNIEEDRTKYENLINEVGEEVGVSLWKSSFGEIPLTEPDRLYSCVISVSGLTMTVTVLERKNTLGGYRKYDTVKLNKININSIDFNNKITVDAEGVLSFEKEILLGKQEDILNSSKVNYEDSNWLTSFNFKKMLGRLKIQLKEYASSIDNENPILDIRNMDFIETVNYEIIDKEFEQKLYDLIDKKFMSLKLE